MSKFGAVCKIDGCHNSNRDKKSFFRFPRDPYVCEKWITACGRPELVEKLKTKGSQKMHYGFRICSDHFRETDFRNKNLYSQGLWPGTVPTVKVHNDDSGKLITIEIPPLVKLKIEKNEVSEEKKHNLSEHDYSLSTNRSIRNLQCEVINLRKKLTDVKYKLRFTQKGLSRYRQKCKGLRSMVLKLRTEMKIKKKQKESKENNVNFYSDNIINQENRLGKLKMGRRYSLNDRKFALALYQSSTKTYEYLQKEFCLPTVRSLRKWLTAKTTPNVDENLADLLEINGNQIEQDIEITSIQTF